MTDLSRLLNGHRSIRRYKQDPIARELIDAVCADAMAGASSSGNLNNVSLVLTQDAQRRQQLYELHARQPMILQAPLLVTFVADCYRTRRWLARGAARDNFNNLMGYHIALCDAMIVALTGWGQAEDRRRSQDAGFDAHMVKPVDPAALSHLLEQGPHNAVAELPAGAARQPARA